MPGDAITFVVFDTQQQLSFTIEARDVGTAATMAATRLYGPRVFARRSTGRPGGSGQFRAYPHRRFTRGGSATSAVGEAFFLQAPHTEP